MITMTMIMTTVIVVVPTYQYLLRASPKEKRAPTPNTIHHEERRPSFEHHQLHTEEKT